MCDSAILICFITFAEQVGELLSAVLLFNGLDQLVDFLDQVVEHSF